MNGLGISHSDGLFAAENDVGMLDVSANALAVLILAAMLALVAVVPPVLRGEVEADTAPSLFYPSPLNSSLAPQSRYVMVLQDGAVELDFNLFARVLAEGETVARTPQGEAVLVTDRRRYRDLNDYRVTIRPDMAALNEYATALDADAVAAEADQAAEKFVSEGVASSYIVAVDAIDSFSALYWALREAQTPMRWVVLPEGQPLIVTRRAEDFERRSRLWQ